MKGDKEMKEKFKKAIAAGALMMLTGYMAATTFAIGLVTFAYTHGELEE